MNKEHLLVKQVAALVDGEENLIANLANTAALLYNNLPDVSWSGFYCYHPQNQQLILGPFQGNPACTRIVAGKGVCGQAWQQEKTIVVPDVHQFAGHIACDAATNSEIVIPLKNTQTTWGVLDLDSTSFSRFSSLEQTFLEEIAEIIGSLNKTA